MCNPSECIEDAFQQLNNIIQGKKSAHFSLKKIKENLQNNQSRFKDHVEEIVQRVLERESKIVREVKNACVKTIKQIMQLAMDIETTPMKKDEEILQNFIACEEFQNENDEEFIKCLYFNNGLKLLQDKYVAQNQNDVPFTLETCDLSVTKIGELVGFVLTNGNPSSDEDSENIEILILNSVSTEKKFLCIDENLYHLSKPNVHELVECVKNFTYLKLMK